MATAFSNDDTEPAEAEAAEAAGAETTTAAAAAEAAEVVETDEATNDGTGRQLTYPEHHARRLL